MALRNQPYFPLYVQDYLTDEKLNLCEWSTQGIYIKILCVLHKQKSYGSILFKQNAKQNSNTVEYFAELLIKHLPCQFKDMVVAINDLVENEVLVIDSEGLHQRRMVKDGLISEARSAAGKKGGGNPNLFKQKPKQIDKQITEYENEYESKTGRESKEKKEREIIKILGSPFLEPVNLWLKYKAEKKQNYKETGFITFLKKLGKMSNGNPTLAMEIIEHSMANNYSGLFPPKGKQNLQTANQSYR